MFVETQLKKYKKLVHIYQSSHLHHISRLACTKYEFFKCFIFSHNKNLRSRQPVRESWKLPAHFTDRAKNLTFRETDTFAFGARVTCTRVQFYSYAVLSFTQQFRLGITKKKNINVYKYNVHA